MSFHRHWLNRFARAFFGPTARTRRVSIAQSPVEALEERKYLSATMSLANQGHTLQIAGDRGDNHIAITQMDHNVVVTADGAPAQRFTDITSIIVSTGDGNDDVRVIYGFNPQPEPPGDTLTPSFDLRVSLGAGDDTFVGDIAFPPGPCRVLVDGSLGNDNVSCIDHNTYGLNSPNGASAIFYANLGAGNDVFNGDFAFPPGPCQVLVVGGDGNDAVSMHMGVDPNGRAALNAYLPSTQFSADLGAGDDTFNGDFAFPPGPCKVSVMGGDGNDAISFHTRPDSSNTSGGGGDTGFGLDLSTDLGNGNDTFLGDIQFPPGPCRVTVNAGAGDDVVALNAMLDHNSGGFNFATNLGLGNDRFDGNIQFPADSSVGTDPLFPPGPCRVSVMGDGGADSINALIGLFSIAVPVGSNGELIGLTPVGDAQLPIEVALNGGDGNDFVRSTFSNVNLNGRTTVDLQGGTGNDYVGQKFDNATINAGLDLNANGGAGDDYVVVTATPESRTGTNLTPKLYVNSQVRLNLEGDLGNDHLIGLVIPCIMPVGSLDLIFSGGSGNDLFNLLIGLEPVSLDSTSGLTAAPTQDGPIRLAVLGGDGDDQLNLTVQNLSNSTSPFDVRLDGGAGRNTAMASPGIDTSGWTN